MQRVLYILSQQFRLPLAVTDTSHKKSPLTSCVSLWLAFFYEKFYTLCNHLFSEDLPMNAKKEYYKNLSNTVLKGFQKRFIEGYYCETKEEAKALALSLVPENVSASFGGSVTLNETGVLEALRNRQDLTLYDRDTANGPEEVKKIMHDALSCDYYFMSSNAITTDGELVNIDGNGNRVAALIYGPENVIIIAGMNKIVKNVEEGISRTRNVAAPPNCIRLNKNTPCAANGVCGNCLSDTICDQIVITRASRVPQRIKVILVGEELGF